MYVVVEHPGIDVSLNQGSPLDEEKDNDNGNVNSTLVPKLTSLVVHQ